MKQKQKSNTLNYIIFVAFILFITISSLVDFSIGERMADNFFIFAWDMVKILPPAFLLIGLFDVWVSRETIEKSFGHVSGFKKYIWSILLATTTVGGTFVAFPVAHSLYKKGAKYSAIFAYITSASLVMVPMTIMEASILGLKFSMVRLGVSLPLVVVSSMFLGSYFESRNYELPEVE